MNTKLRLAAAAAALVAVNATGAQPTFPQDGKPITIVVPFTAGGPTDRVARDLAESLRKTLGQGAMIVIDNAAGAGSTVGTAKVARAQPDGYTLLLNHIGMATVPSLYRKLSFNVTTDFEFLGIVNDVPMTLITRPTHEAKDLPSLLDWLKQNNSSVNLANAGTGSASHLCGLMLENTLGVKFTTVPYKGAAPAITDLMGNTVDVLCDQTTNTTSQIEAKKVKAYAVTTPSRLTTPALSHLPSMAESGYPNFNVTIWHGLYAPKGTPEHVLAKINSALKVALKDPEFVKKQEALGAVIASDDRTSRAGHKVFVEREIDIWSPVIKAAGQFEN